jgi:hypothetical protein
MTAADQRLLLRQQKTVLLQQPLQVATTTMMMTVDQLQQPRRLLVRLQLQVLPQADQRLQLRQQQRRRLQARLEGPNSLTSLVFFSYHKNKFCLIHKLKVRISSSIKLDQQECRI